MGKSLRGLLGLLALRSLFGRRYYFRMAVQAEIKAQTDDQEFVNVLCDHSDAIELIYDYWEHLHRERGYAVLVAAFLTTFGVYAQALNRNDVSLSDKMRIARYLNERKTRAQKNHAFYSRYFHIFSTGTSALEEFCVTHDLTEMSEGEWWHDA